MTNNQYEIEIKNIKDFKLKDIFENGQCFRWKKLEEHTYLSVFKNYVLIIKEYIRKNKNEISTDLDILVFSEEKFKKEKYLEKIKEDIIEYFDLNTDYGKIKEKLKAIGNMKKAVEFGKGIRILNQEKIETILSFIISANNNIPRIKKTIHMLCEKWGKKIEISEKIKEKYNIEDQYSFPQIEELIKIKEEDFRNIGAGFRAKRLVDTINMLNEGFLEEKYTNLEEKLIKLPGVGPKVANCIMLFAYHNFEAFPIDVWVKRVMSEEFFEGKDIPNSKIVEFVKDIEYKGLMQQYLFYWRREKDNG